MADTSVEGIENRPRRNGLSRDRRGHYDRETGCADREPRRETGM